MTPELIACYWTLAGQVIFGPDDHSSHDLKNRAQAAAQAGYRGIGLKHADLIRAKTRYGWEGLRSILRDNGLIHLEVEALGDWWGEGDARRQSDVVRRDLLEAATQLGARHLKVYGAIPADTSPPVDVLRTAFDELARQARDAGTCVALEPIACSGIPCLDTALAILGDNLGNGAGLMLDAWHVARGGLPLEQIAALPPGAIAGAELDDGPLQGDDYLFETMNRRLLPGEGAFDLVAIINAIHAAGYRGPWGVEIMSDEQRAQPPESAAKRSFDATARIFMQTAEAMGRR